MKILYFASLILAAECISEPHCPKFHYEEKLLEKMIRTEIFVGEMKKEMDLTQKTVEESLEQLMEQKRSWATEIEEMIKSGESQLATLQEKARSENKNNVVKVEPIGFSMTVPDKTTGSGTSPLKFKTLIYNTGNGYDQSTGVFTCQHPGLYYFTATIIKSPGSSECYCYFHVNENSKLIVYNGVQSNQEYKSGSGAIVIMLEAGDRVYLSGCGGVNNLYTFSSFSGFRVNN